jgi:TP901 family phage tail tape measure protein
LNSVVIKTPPVVNMVGNAFGKVARSVKGTVSQFGAGLGKLSGAATTAGMAFAPLTAGVGLAMRSAAQFEAQMATVKAVSDADGKTMRMLTDLAIEMGSSTAYSATEAAQGMELLYRAGIKNEEMAGALKGTLMAASAEGIDMATSASIVSQVVKGLGMSFTDAARVADVLAKGSAATNSSIISLGESFKYGVPMANALGYSLEEITAIFGKLADAGLQGSMGGTSFNSMMTRLLKPTGKAKKYLDGWNISLTDSEGKFKKMPEVVEAFASRIDTLGSEQEKAKAAVTIFGAEGFKAYNALRLAAKDSNSTVSSLTKSLMESQGSATKMAMTRLQSFSGAAKMLGNAMETLSIAVFQTLLPAFTEPFAAGLDAIKGVVGALNELNKVAEADAATQSALAEKYGATTVQIALGIKDAIIAVGSAFNTVMAWFRDLGKTAEQVLGKDTVRSIAKFAVLFVAAAAAAGPLLLSLGGIAFLITSVVIPAISGIGTVIGAIISGPGLAIIAVLFGLFGAARKEGESFWQTMYRIYTVVKTAFLGVWNTAIWPFIQGIMDFATPAVEAIGEAFGAVFSAIGGIIADFADSFGLATAGAAINWRTLAQFLVAMIVTAIQIVCGVITVIIDVVRYVAYAIEQALVWPFVTVWNVIKGFVAGFQDIFEGNILRGIAKIGVALVDLILSPLTLILRNFIKLADIVGVGIPDALRKFAEEGATGLIFNQATAPASTWVQPAVSEAVAPWMEPMQSVPEDITAMKATEKERLQNPKIKNDITLNAKHNIAIDNKLSVSGEALNVASGKHKREIYERSGFQSTPWQRRLAAERGLVMARG